MNHARRNLTLAVAVGLALTACDNDDDGNDTDAVMMTTGLPAPGASTGGGDTDTDTDGPDDDTGDTGESGTDGDTDTDTDTDTDGPDDDDDGDDTGDTGDMDPPPPPDDDDGDPPDLTNVVYSDVQEIFEGICQECHNSVDLPDDSNFNVDDGPNSWRGTASAVSSGILLIGAEPQSSYIYRMVTGDIAGRPQMPPGGALSDDDIDLIGAWIDNGAP